MRETHGRTGQNSIGLPSFIPKDAADDKSVSSFLQPFNARWLKAAFLQEISRPLTNLLACGAQAVGDAWWLV
jgi:hypothetical protein